MASANNGDDDARAAMEAARTEVLEAEKEIQSIKASVRALGVSEALENSFKITIVKVIGLPESAEPIMKFQLSSPVEEVTLTKVGEEAIVRGVDASLATMTCRVSDKDISLGTSASLEVAPLCEFNVNDTSAVVTTNQLDIAIVPMKGIDDIDDTTTDASATTTTDEITEPTADEPNESTEATAEELKESTEIVVDESKESTETVVDETKEMAEEVFEDSNETVVDKVVEVFDRVSEEFFGDAIESVEEAVVEIKDSSDDVVVVSTSEKEEEDPVVKDEPIKEEPVVKDEPVKDEPVIKEEPVVKEESTEGAAPQMLIPICTVQVKVDFEPAKKDRVDALYAQLNEASKRKSKAIDALRKSATAVGRTTVARAEPSTPSIKSGFLNAKKKKATPLWKRWYEKTIGPRSMTRMIAPMFKNYALFLGAVAFFHFRGSDLALEAPV